MTIIMLHEEVVEEVPVATLIPLLRMKKEARGVVVVVIVTMSPVQLKILECLDRAPLEVEVQEARITITVMDMIAGVVGVLILLILLQTYAMEVMAFTQKTALILKCIFKLLIRQLVNMLVKMYTLGVVEVQVGVSMTMIAKEALEEVRMAHGKMMRIAACETLVVVALGLVPVK